MAIPTFTVPPYLLGDIEAALEEMPYPVRLYVGHLRDKNSKLESHVSHLESKLDKLIRLVDGSNPGVVS